MVRFQVEALEMQLATEAAPGYGPGLGVWTRFLAEHGILSLNRCWGWPTGQCDLSLPSDRRMHPILNR